MDFDKGRERGFDRERFNRGGRDESKNQGGQGQERMIN